MLNTVFFKEHLRSDGFFIAEIKLNNPTALNALTLNMILSIKNQLIQWRDNKKLAGVFLHSAVDKAFCVGGDIKSLYRDIVSAENKNEIQKKVQPFFENEYRLDYLLHTYSCPVVIWGHGFVIGGGAGLFLAGSHKIATHEFSLSMPEITIGLFTDVGSSYVLSRFPKNLGLYIALTAYRLNPQEAHDLHIVDYFFDNTQKLNILEVLKNSTFKTKKQLSDILNKIPLKNSAFKTKKQLSDILNKIPLKNNAKVASAYKLSADKCYFGENWLKKHEDKITSLCESQNIKTIYKKICDSSIIHDKKGEKNQHTFLKGSPTSAAIICELFKRAKKSNLKTVFKTDLTVGLNCASGKDFTEGVKSLLIEKTFKPQWNPTSINKIQDNIIKKYFESDFGEQHPLNDL